MFTIGESLGLGIEKKSCANCNFCKQYFTGDYYPEFGCKIGQDFKEDDINFPSDKDGCAKWDVNTRNLWTE